jgi:WD repeat-containing protein 35
MSTFHVFLSKKMKFSSDNPMTKMSWNRHNTLIAAGFHDGKISLFLVTPSRDQPGSVSVETTQTLDAHRKHITTITWSENGKLLASGDTSGKIAFYTKKDKGWENIGANSSVTASVNCIAISKNNKVAAIAYHDSTCACVWVEGDLNWSNEMRQEVEFVELSPNHKVLLCGITYGEVMILDSRCIEVGIVTLPWLSKAKVKTKISVLE